MIFENMDFHNVEEIEKTEQGFILWRLPKFVRGLVNEGIATKVASYSCGVELRFRMNSPSVDIYMSVENETEAQVACIFYGDIPGGWQNSTRHIGVEKTLIHIEKPQNIEELRRVRDEQHLPFDPEVVRLILPYGNCRFYSIDGEVEPPKPEDVPHKAYLAYGSSITHGSLALMTPYTYPFRIARNFGCDYYNMGFAGAAQLEPELAKYLVSRKNWNFATLEMGVNLLSDEFSDDFFEQRVDEFTKVFSQDSRPVFATNIYGLNGNRQEKAARYRKIVKKYASERLIFVDGLDLLNHSSWISQDMTHPNLWGVEEIAKNWTAAIGRYDSIIGRNAKKKT